MLISIKETMANILLSTTRTNTMYFNIKTVSGRLFLIKTCTVVNRTCQFFYREGHLILQLQSLQALICLLSISICINIYVFHLLNCFLFFWQPTRSQSILLLTSIWEITKQKHKNSIIHYLIVIVK